MLFGVSELPTVDQFINYGSFGLVAFLVMAFVFRIYPSMLKSAREEREEAEKAAQQERERTTINFTAVVTKLVDQFHIESLQCKLDREEARTERIQSSKDAAVERDKDRELRHELKNTLNLIQLKIEKDNRREGK